MEAHCPEFQHMKADLTFHPSAEPDVEIHGGAQPPGYAQLAIDLTENPPDPEVVRSGESPSASSKKIGGPRAGQYSTPSVWLGVRGTCGLARKR